MLLKKANYINLKNKLSFILNETYQSGIYSIENLKSDFSLVLAWDYIEHQLLGMHHLCLLDVPVGTGAIFY